MDIGSLSTDDTSNMDSDNLVPSLQVIFTYFLSRMARITKYIGLYNILQPTPKLISSKTNRRMVQTGFVQTQNVVEF